MYYTPYIPEATQQMIEDACKNGNFSVHKEEDIYYPDFFSIKINNKHFRISQKKLYITIICQRKHEQYVM